MENIDIVWFIEHTVRELDVACAAVHYLKKHYHRSVEILPFHHKDISLIPRLYNPKIVVIPYCYSVYDSGTSEILPKLLKPIYFNLYWEQILYKANTSYKAPHDLFAREYVIHHAWSKKNAGYFSKEHQIPKSHIFINGQPAYKLFEKPYSDLYPSKKALAGKFALNEKQKWLFFPENFSWAFYSESQLKQIIKFGQDEKNALLMRNYCKLLFKKVIAWFKEASLFPVEIILRPRPAISKNDFVRAVREVIPKIPDNLHIIADLSVREWILASDIVVSSFSTSLIEASIAQKPIFMTMPIPMPAPLQTDWYRFVPKLMTKDDFIDVCYGRKNNNSGKKLGEWAKKEFMANGDAIKNLADFLNGLLESRKRPLPKLTGEVIRQSCISLPKQFLFYLLIRHITAKARDILFPQAKFIVDDSFTLQVKKRFKILEKIIG